MQKSPVSAPSCCKLVIAALIVGVEADGIVALPPAQEACAAPAAAIIRPKLKIKAAARFLIVIANAGHVSGRGVSVLIKRCVLLI